MFSALVVGPTPERAQVLSSVALETGRLLLVRVLEEYLQGFSLARLLHSIEPEVILLDLDRSDAALECIDGIRQYSPKTPVVGLLEPPLPRGQDEEGAGGLDAVLALPVTPADLSARVDAVLRRALSERKENLIAFLPAKGGCGSTTLVWNTAAALSELPLKRPLVIETDYRCGALAFMLDQKPQGSLQDVLRAANELDGTRLTAAITNREGVALLLSDRTIPDPAPGWETYTRLIDMAAARYDPVLVDLPAAFPPELQEITRRAGKVILVTTPDVVALKLAEGACAELLAAGLEESRLHVVLNRKEESDLDQRAIEDLLQRPVLYAVPADNRAARAAVFRGERVSPKSELGRSLQKLAAKLMEESREEPGTMGGKLRNALRLAAWRS
jgi:pilus assembly protein CpaE